MTDGSETVLVVGGGLAGLSLALALEGSGKRVVIIERDGEPPELAPDQAFEGWKRPGVSQFRYPHVFVGRLQGLLRSRYPQLFQELEQAGVRASTFVEGLPPALREGYVPEADDVLKVSLCGRRATVEYVLRRHVGRMPHVSFVHGAVAQNLVSERVEAALRIVGVEVKRAETREVLRGDVIVDAAGRNSPLRAWLEALGGKIDVRQEPSDFVYFCRHYRVRQGEAEPEHFGISADLDYLKYAIFYAEHGHFAIAFACAEHESDLVSILRQTDSFDSLCAEIPALVPWVRCSDPLTKVLGAAKITNRWSRIADAPAVSGMFLLGDAGFEANPIYGRGSAAAFVQSHLLADALVSESEHARRMAKFETGLRAELLPYHKASISADRMFHSRARRALGQRQSLARRLEMYGYENVIVPAVLVDMGVAREILNVMGMGHPASPMRVLRFVLRVLAIWLFRPKSVTPLLPPNPERAELLERVAAPLPAQASNAALSEG